MSCNQEKMLTAIVNGEPSTITPRSRSEQYLCAIANGTDPSTLPEPRCRSEVLLKRIAEKGMTADRPDQSKTVTPTTSKQVVTPDSGYELASVTVNPVTSAIDSNIVAENIKKDVSILGVTGTLEQGGGSTSEEWQPNPTWWDIKTILDNDTRDYAYKVIYLYTNSTIAESELALNGQAYATSDGAFYDYGSTVTPFTHTWDLSKDKPCYIDGVEVYKTRYVIVYSNSYANPPQNQKTVLWVYGLDTSDRTTMTTTFQNYYHLETSPVFDMSNITQLYRTFYYCRSLQKVPALDTSKVTNMSGLFENCSSLQKVPALDTSKVTNMSNMFQSCSSLQKVPALDTSKVTNMSNMFNNCTGLKIVSKLDMINVNMVSSMFYYCPLIIDLKLYNIKVSSLQIGSGTSWGNLLSIDCLTHIIQQLWDYSSDTATYTLTIGTANTAKLANVYVKLITATDEMIAEDPNINSKMPFEVCASTDEGAMLIMDYALLKNWTIT